MIVTAQGLPTDLQTLQAIDALYQDAWDRMVWVVSIGGVIIGVLLPLGIQWLQSKRVRIEKDNLLRELHAAAEKSASEVLSTIDSRIEHISEKAIATLESRLQSLERRVSSAQAGIQWIQATAYFEARDYTNALGCFVACIQQLVQCEHEVQMRRTLTKVAECLGQLGKSELESHQAGDLVKSTEALISMLASRDQTAYKDELVSTRSALAKAMKR